MGDDVERFLASELFENEYAASAQDLEKNQALSTLAAKRIIKALAARGYVIRKSDD
jgi:hypothetical protein